jgi:hypothetical protein
MITSVPKTFDLYAFLQAVGSWFDIEAVSQTGGDPDSEVLHFQNRLREGCRVGTTIGVCLKDRPTGYIFSLKPDAREAMGRDLHPSLRKLDVLVLSRLILQRAVGFNQEDLDNEKLFHYESSMKKAITRVRQGDCRMAFLLNPTPMEQVKEIAGNGLVMPRKSTFFYPKILTGLVFNPIDPHEVIQVP